MTTILVVKAVIKFLKCSVDRYITTVSVEKYDVDDCVRIMEVICRSSLCQAFP